MSGWVGCPDESPWHRLWDCMKEGIFPNLCASCPINRKYTYKVYWESIMSEGTLPTCWHSYRISHDKISQFDDTCTSFSIMTETKPLLSNSDGNGYYFLNDGSKAPSPSKQSSYGGSYVDGVPAGANADEFEPRKLTPKRQVRKFLIPYELCVKSRGSWNYCFLFFQSL